MLPGVDTACAKRGVCPAESGKQSWRLTAIRSVAAIIACRTSSTYGAQELGTRCSRRHRRSRWACCRRAKPPEPVEVTMPKNFPRAAIADPGLAGGNRRGRNQRTCWPRSGSSVSRSSRSASAANTTDTHGPVRRGSARSIMAGKDLHEACWPGRARCGASRGSSSQQRRATAEVLVATVPLLIVHPREDQVQELPEGFVLCILIKRMKLWAPAEGDPDTPGSAQRIRMSDATTRVPGVSSPEGQSPSGWNLTSNWVAFLQEEEI